MKTSFLCVWGGVGWGRRTKRAGVKTENPLINLSLSLLSPFSLSLFSPKEPLDHLRGVDLVPGPLASPESAGQGNPDLRGPVEGRPRRGEGLPELVRRQQEKGRWQRRRGDGGRRRGPPPPRRRAVAALFLLLSLPLLQGHGGQSLPQQLGAPECDRRSRGGRSLPGGRLERRPRCRGRLPPPRQRVPRSLHPPQRALLGREQQEPAAVEAQRGADVEIGLAVVCGGGRRRRRRARAAVSAASAAAAGAAGEDPGRRAGEAVAAAAAAAAFVAGARGSADGVALEELAAGVA